MTHPKSKEREKLGEKLLAARGSGITATTPNPELNPNPIPKPYYQKYNPSDHLHSARTSHAQRGPLNVLSNSKTKPVSTGLPGRLVTTSHVHTPVYGVATRQGARSVSHNTQGLYEGCNAAARAACVSTWLGLRFTL